MKNSTNRVWFCVVLTDINICCRSVLIKEIESEEQHRMGVVFVSYNTD